MYAAEGREGGGKEGIKEGKAGLKRTNSALERKGNSCVELDEGSAAGDREGIPKNLQGGHGLSFFKCKEGTRSTVSHTKNDIFIEKGDSTNIHDNQHRNIKNVPLHRPAIATLHLPILRS